MTGLQERHVPGTSCRCNPKDGGHDQRGASCPTSYQAFAPGAPAAGTDVLSAVLQSVSWAPLHIFSVPSQGPRVLESAEHSTVWQSGTWDGGLLVTLVFMTINVCSTRQGSGIFTHPGNP